ncbi:DEAD/DEAH box helicase family protein [Sedimentimonas flavescens]|uniref:DEAD/DEAH box helicase family protein n=1 Tax=Sedimentimonas flavescens TaxID=2851012 RepID=UPI0021A800B9|nr:DEAD/DEAH box helicase family protein [Sedimentimonas flavescens]MCT2541264.1 DEAD/DEAH box helicase family protein [Sedimentimonas flavescens]
MTQFAFLAADFPDLHRHAIKAEKHARSDPRGACFWARLTLETALNWLFEREPALRRVYSPTLAAMIAEPSLTTLTGPAITKKADYIRTQGNRAAHDSGKPITAHDGVATVRELFHVCYWIARTYAKTARPDPGLRFDADRLETSVTISASTVAQIQKIEQDFAATRKRAEEAEEKLRGSEEVRQAADAALAAARAELEALRRVNQAVPDPHDYDEAATRDNFIDLLLKEAGWALDQTRDREFPVTGMPNQSGEGFVDYVLWGKDGKPLAVVEAKRTKKDSRIGQEQAKLYADCLETAYGQRPVIFTTNGFEHWIWDDAMYPPRRISGFLKQDELALLQQRRGHRKPLEDIEVDKEIAGRFYQQRAIRRVGQTFEKDHQRKALLVMATGSGKTRTVVALIDQLMKANWVKRVLFLADRRALVRQAHGAFKTHLAATPSANLLERHDPAKNDHSGARVLFSTYPTMMGLIEEVNGGKKRFGPGHFDLIVIDEAHRSVYRKYRAIFDYFDSLLIGLTATPKDEIDRDTYSLFNLERGVPTDAYDLDDAVGDGYLVPPRSISVPLKFQREGITYDDLSEQEKEEWDALEWNEDGEIPDRVEAADLNKWLFNIDTVDKVLEHVMRNGIRVEDGDRLGKTIIFAKSSKHAQFIVDRFNANYPHYQGKFARLIDYSVNYAQSLIDDFSEPTKAPHIAVSVDMMDTGIDVPEVVNLVFFKIVRSKTKFWQMVGRGTRLCPDLFGPGEHKSEFLIFDFCQNLEFFRENPDRQDAAVAAPIGQRLFSTRVELICDLQEQAEDHTALIDALKGRLQSEVDGMSLDNFIVRDKRRAVERFQDKSNWSKLSLNDRMALIDEVAGLPSAFEDDNLPAKQFDLLMLNTQIALLRGDAGFARLQTRIRATASALEPLTNVPKVAQQMALILEVQTDEFWSDVTVEILEEVRRKLRLLTDLIKPVERKDIITNFADDIGAGDEVDLPQVGGGIDKARFTAKVRQFVDAHLNHIALQKIRRAEPVTKTDLDELQRMLLDQGVADQETLTALIEEQPLGNFLRRLVGLDRSAAKDAFSEFVTTHQLNADQTEFIDMIVDHLTDSGIVEPAAFYESPFSDLNDMGIAGVFSKDQTARIIMIVREINNSAEAA